MKKVVYIFGLLVLFACKSKTKSVLTDTTSSKSITTETSNKTDKLPTITPYKMNGDYTVIDTGFFDASVSEGTYAVVQRNGKLADTIDKYYGIKEIDTDDYLYFTISNTGPLDKGMSPKAGYKNSISGSLGNYIIVINGKKQYLNKLIRDFDDYFSSPSVIDHKIYFWQLKKLDKDGKISVSAAEYNPVSKSLKSSYIKNDIIETDDSGYFPYPYLKEDTLYFDAGKDKLMKFSKDFKAYN